MLKFIVMTCRYRFACVISFLDFACMLHICVCMVLLLSLASVFLGVKMFFSLVFPFSDTHRVMGSLVFG